VLVGHADGPSEPPAGGGGHDAEPALPAQELRTQLHPQDEDGSAGRGRGRPADGVKKNNPNERFQV